MKRAFALVLLGLASFAVAQRATTKYTFNGTPVGENEFEYKAADGSFTSATNLNIAGTKIKSDFSGVIKQGSIVEFMLSESQGNVAGTITYKNGKVSAVQNGKPIGPETAVKWDGLPVFQPFHPQMARAYMPALLRSPNKTKLKFISPNAMTAQEFDVSVTRKNVTLAGKAVSVAFFKISVSGIGIEYAILADNSPVGMDVKVQKLSATTVGYEGVFEDPLAKYPELSQPTFAKVKREKMSTPMRDGAVLISEVVRPDAEGKFPTVLIRTPYGRAASAAEGDFYARRGFVLMSQDVRGKGDSTGLWDPFNAEVADGKDTLDWIQKQPWSDGGVGMIGGSYLGLVQWAAAVTHHPALKCIIPQVSPPDPMRNVPWDNGAFLLSGNVWWSRIVKDKNADMAAAGVGMASVFNQLKTTPIDQVDNQVFKVNIPFYDNWIQRDTIDKWKGAFRMDQIATVKIPVLHVSGVWDGDGIGTKLHWETLRKAKANQMLVFGPWEHGFNVKTKFADEDYGPGSILELDSLYLRFFDTHLKGKSVKLNEQPRVKYFVSGSNEWLTGNDWPLPASRRVTYYLSGQKANGGKSAGKLSAAAGSGTDVYAYDPNKPLVRQEDLEVDSAKASIVFKQKDLNDGMLLYASEPFGRDTIVSGPMEVNLTVSSTAKDATFHAMIVEQSTNGDCRIWQMPGTQRVTYTTGKFVPMTPGAKYKIKIMPWEGARRFRKGSRLALFVTSDMFPRFARNPGTGERDAVAKKLVAAKHTIYKAESTVSFQILER